MTLFERAAALMSDGRYWTRRQLLDALDVPPKRLQEVLQSAVCRGAFERTPEKPMRFRLLDPSNKGGWRPRLSDPKPAPQFWIAPVANRPRQWFEV